MGRIAYLSKRGNIWWFRRRFPVLFIKSSQNNLISGVCVETGKRAQATGHLAISLQTPSLREARLIGAQVSADFERAWSMVEARMSKNDLESDMLDAIAMAMTNGFRSYIGALRTGIAANQNPRVKERAYRIVEADIRNALGIETEPPTQVSASAPADEPSTGGAAAVASPEPDEMSEDELLAIEAEIEEYEQHSLLSHIGPSARSQDDYYAEHIVNEFSVHTAAFRVTLSEYLEACERLGLDPRKATPDFETALKEALKAAKDIGLAQEAAIKAERNPAGKKIDADQAKRLFSEFAEEYLSLRCQGYDFKREDETADANSGRRFEKSSLRNWQSSVRIFTEIVGDLPIGEYTKDDIVEFNDLLQRLPSNFGKSSKDKRTAREVIEEIETEEERAIAAKSEALRNKGLPETEIDDELAKVMIRRISANTMTRLTRARVPDHVRKGLMGHEQTDVTHKNYFRAGETMPSLKEYVDRIDINYSGILPPLGWADTYKRGLRVVGGGNP